ncbi:MAG: aromatic ring-hydroxylating oxygenase subunit alpha, partial [Candidatus Binatia bacterium]
MKRETQIELIREILRSIDRGSSSLGETFTRNDPRIYTSPERDARERDVLFRRQPLVVGVASELRRPGDYLTESLSPVPILVVRQASGELRAFVNVCRHRGSRLVEGSGTAPRGFTCPYHAWSYEPDGRLADIPDEFGFPGLDRSRQGLIEIPVAERHGLVWVLPEPGGSFSVDEILRGLGEELDSYGIAGHRVFETRVVRRRMNWKLASDTFWEAYHLKVLHRRTIAKLFLRNIALFHPFGRSHRFVGVRESIVELRGRPETEWDLLPHATILMNLFPNTVLIMQSDHLELFRIFPAPDRVNECAVAVSLLAPGAESGEEHQRRWKQTMDLLMGVLDEDFTNGEAIQRNFETGFPDHVVYGRYENAL